MLGTNVRAYVSTNAQVRHELGVASEAKIKQESGERREQLRKEKGKGASALGRERRKGREPRMETKGRKKSGRVRQRPVGVTKKRGEYRVGKWVREGRKKGEGRQKDGLGRGMARRRRKREWKKK